MNKLKRRRRRRRRGKWRNDWQISVIIVMMNTMFVRLSAAAVSVGQTKTKWAGLNPWEDFLHSSTCAWVENRDWTLELGLTAAICTTFSMEIPPLLFLKHFFFIVYFTVAQSPLSLARSDGPFQLHWRKCTWLIWLLPGVASSEIINQFIFSHLLDDMMLFSHKSLNNRLSNAFIKQRWLLLRSLLFSGLHTHAGS